MTTPESRRNFASQLKREGVGQEEGEEDGEGGRQTKTRIFYLQPFHSLQEEFREKKQPNHFWPQETWSPLDKQN